MVAHTLGLLARASFDDVPHPDVILVPGGAGQADHMTGGPLRDWLSSCGWAKRLFTSAQCVFRASQPTTIDLSLGPAHVT